MNPVIWKILVQIGLWFCGISLLLGLIQPWWVLWWQSSQYRLKVLRYYGLPFLVFLLLYFLFFS